MDQKRKLLVSAIIRIAFFPLFMGLIVLWPAGTFDFWEVYIYFGVLFIPLCAAMVYLYRNDPGLLERRMRTNEQETSQRVFVAISTISIMGTFLLPGFDKRFGWSEVPGYLVIIADLVVIAAYLFIFQVFRTNSYASRVVEVEEDQKVISTGPYAAVRHPMYTGIFFLYLASSVALGSWWGMIPAATILPVLILRCLDEERLLKKDLPGYVEYCGKVRYRMFPLIW